MNALEACNAGNWNNVSNKQCLHEYYIKNGSNLTSVTRVLVVAESIPEILYWGSALNIYLCSCLLLSMGCSTSHLLLTFYSLLLYVTAWTSHSSMFQDLFNEMLSYVYMLQSPKPWENHQLLLFHQLQLQLQGQFLARGWVYFRWCLEFSGGVGAATSTTPLPSCLAMAFVPF